MDRLLLVLFQKYLFDLNLFFSGTTNTIINFSLVLGDAY